MVDGARMHGTRSTCTVAASADAANPSNAPTQILAILLLIIIMLYVCIIMWYEVPLVTEYFGPAPSHTEGKNHRHPAGRVGVGIPRPLFFLCGFSSLAAFCHSTTHTT